MLQGSVVVRHRRKVVVEGKVNAEGKPVERERSEAVVLHCDIIRDDPFWTVDHPGLLTS